MFRSELRNKDKIHYYCSVVEEENSGNDVDFQRATKPVGAKS